jgi:hypothetical protein
MVETAGHIGQGGRGRGPADSSRKRKSLQAKDDFDKKHEKNLSKVYAVWGQEKDLIEPTKYWWNRLLKLDEEAVKPYTMDNLMGEGKDTIHNMCRIADKK